MTPTSPKWSRKQPEPDGSGLFDRARSTTVHPKSRVDENAPVVHSATALGGTALTVYNDIGDRSENVGNGLGQKGVMVMRVALAQTDSKLGDLNANLGEAEAMVRQAAERDVDLVVFPELSLHGYALGKLPEDRSVAVSDERLTRLSGFGPDVLVGLHEDGRLRRYNSAAYCAQGEVVHTHRKLYLPNYLGWEERKHASPGSALRAYETRHARMATLICNDAWQPVLPWLAAQDGAEVLLVPTNSAAGVAPGAVDTESYWRDLLLFIARMQQCWVVFVNRVGDEAGVSFWGGSRVLDPWGEVVAEAPRWDPSLTVVDVDVQAARRRRREMPLLQESRFGLVSREVARLMEENAD